MKAELSENNPPIDKSIHQQTPPTESLSWTDTARSIIEGVTYYIPRFFYTQKDKPFPEAELSPELKLHLNK